MAHDLIWTHFLEKINDVRRVNLNENLSDEERRKNAENALEGTGR